MRLNTSQLLFLVTIGLSSFPILAPLHAYPNVVVNNVTPSPMEGPIHHGLVIETDGIIDPNLTFYEVQVKPDNGRAFPPWAIYSNDVQPYDSRLINAPYRNGLLSLIPDQPYCVRVRAVYGLTVTPWAERCGVVLAVGDALDLDEDGDGLSDADEFAWGLDPRDPDSDDDGVSDGDEVAAGRDPLHSPGDPDLILRTASIDFVEGDAMGHRRNQHQFIEIENVGDEVAEISAVEIVGASPEGVTGYFHVGAYPRLLTNIPPQSTAFIPVSFIPRRRGEASAQVQITSNDPVPLEPVPLHGFGVDIPDCLVTPAEIDFGEIAVGDQEVAVREVTLANRQAEGDTQPPNPDWPWGFTLSTSFLEYAPGIRGLILEQDEEMRVPVLFQHPRPGDFDDNLEVRSFHCGVQTVRLRGRVTE